MNAIEKEQVFVKNSRQMVDVTFSNLNHRKRKKNSINPTKKQTFRLIKNLDKDPESIVEDCQRKVKAMEKRKLAGVGDDLVIKDGYEVALYVSHMTPNRQASRLKHSCQIKPALFTKATSEMIIKCIEVWSTPKSLQGDAKNNFSVYNEQFMW